jgi:DNA repair exonuclease SbcCD nuclease subunit
LSRFLHTADWQIGRQFSALHPDNAVPLAEARIDAVERLARLAQQHQVDAVLVAGDVFDAQGVSDKLIRRLFNALAGFSGPWLLIPGNHDAALAESVWTRARRLDAVPAQAHLLLGAEVAAFPELGFAALPAPLTQRHTHADLTAWFDAAETEPGLLRIGLAHGSVQGILAEGIDSANPIAADRCTRARLDYLALGDWHGCKQIEPRCWYAGTPEPDRFKANDAGRALLVEISGPGAVPQVTPLAVGRYRWRGLEVNLQVATDLDGLLDELAGLGADDVLALTLDGVIDLASQQRLDRVLGELEARVRHLQVDNSALRLVPTDADLADLQADGYLGEVIAELRQEGAVDSPDGRTAQQALVVLAGLLAQRRPAAAPGAGVTSAPNHDKHSPGA